ncbi:MAG: response regulator transcription factor [Acidobacteria bacterium]|nr:response regulator transcription factor [Acidobacteriota bacterium]
MEIKTVIVDDEPLALEEMDFLLKELSDVRVVGRARNGLEAVDVVKKTGPDLLLLDIQMPGMDGFGVLKQILKKGRAPHVVFVTAFDEYAIKAFEFNAVDYLLKPVEKRRLAQALEKARRVLAGSGDRDRDREGGGDGRLERLLATLERKLEPPRKLTIKVGGRYMLIDAREIIYATVEEGAIVVVTDSLAGSSNCRTLDELQQTLPGDLFWRAHRSHIVNINRVREVLPMFKRTYYLKMADPKAAELPVSRAQISRLKELFRF